MACEVFSSVFPSVLFISYYLSFSLTCCMLNVGGRLYCKKRVTRVACAHFFPFLPRPLPMYMRALGKGTPYSQSRNGKAATEISCIWDLAPGYICVAL